MECSFPFKSAELTGKASLGGQIQILSYEGWREEKDAWADCGYTYKWVPWKEARAGRPAHMQLVGQSINRLINQSGALWQRDADHDGGH